MRTAILTIKPIDDHGVIDDEKERTETFYWDAEGVTHEDLAFDLGDFLIRKVAELEALVLSEDEPPTRYVETLPAFDLTLELREK